MAVFELGTLVLNRLEKPGRGWDEGIEGVRLSVEDDRWVAEDLTKGASSHLVRAVENIRTQSSASQKLCTILSVSDSKPGNVAAALHVLELVLADVLEPEVRRVLAQVTSVTGVRLPRWQLQFVPTVWLNQGPGWLWEIEQVNAYASRRTR